jgi:hypothetical protein
MKIAKTVQRAPTKIRERADSDKVSVEAVFARLVSATSIQWRGQRGA